MKLETIEKQILFWNKAAIIAPAFFTVLLSVMWAINLYHIEVLFFIACGLYFITAIIWWWWTMKSIYIILKLMANTNNNLEDVSIELKHIRNDIQVDYINRT